jgi:DNA segregation ATPase FtsK/SpoIIIE, S-DNA-T family
MTGYYTFMAELIKTMNDILSKLEIKAECVNAERHRHLAFFDIKLDIGTKVSKIESYSKEIGLALKCKASPIITIITELGIIRVKVAFDDAPIIDFKELFKSSLPHNGTLPLLLGETDSGEEMWVDMAKLPHALVSGTTGSGKSTLLHTIISNVIDRFDCHVYLADPKRGVEFGGYKNKAIKIATDYNSTLDMLYGLQKIMEHRYTQLEAMGLRSIEDNTTIFSKILVVIDEVADIMLTDNNRNNSKRGEFERVLCNLAAKSRASGIYIILATQRPSVDVITGMIKANFPARFACKVSSGVDSKVILDQLGAEELLGRGDTILKSPNHNMIRFQSAYVEP